MKDTQRKYELVKHEKSHLGIIKAAATGRVAYVVHYWRNVSLCNIL